MLNKFTKILKKERIERGMTQEEVGEIINITKQQYCLYEQGKRIMPIDKMIKLAKLYNISMDYFLGIEEFKRPFPKNK